MIFASDNWAGASEPIMAALAERAAHVVPAYGNDELTRQAADRFSEIFERDVAVFFVATGTAANALALATFSRPGGFVFSHRLAHVVTSEMGATELFGGGLRLVGLDGPAATMAPDMLRQAIERFGHGSPLFGDPVAVSLSQLSELGAAYTPEHIAEIADLAKHHGLGMHMDGARFASAIAGLGVAPADVTWRAGVDVMSFGGTKNGCLTAEAVIFFDPHRAEGFAAARQRAGHAFSKSWFVAAQFLAYLADGHWLDLARQANDRAQSMAMAIEASASARLACRRDGNEIFAVLAKPVHDRLQSSGAVYYQWPDDDVGASRCTDEVLVRLVTSFATTQEEVDRFAAIVAG